MLLISPLRKRGDREEPYKLHTLNMKRERKLFNFTKSSKSFPITFSTMGFKNYPKTQSFLDTNPKSILISVFFHKRTLK